MICKSKSFVVWKPGHLHSGCEGKVLRVYRSDRSVSASCNFCGALVYKGIEKRLDSGAIISPRVEAQPITWQIRESRKIGHNTRLPRIESQVLLQTCLD